MNTKRGNSEQRSDVIFERVCWRIDPDVGKDTHTDEP